MVDTLFTTLTGHYYFYIIFLNRFCASSISASSRYNTVPNCLYANSYLSLAAFCKYLKIWLHSPFSFGSNQMTFSMN